MEEKIGVLFLNLREPETLDDVQPFLFNLMAEPNILHLPRLFQFLQHSNTPLVVNLANESDYAILLYNKLGQTNFGGGYVHNGMLKAVGWIFNAESEVLREFVERNPNYTLTFTDHFLGAGEIALLIMVVVQNSGNLGNMKEIGSNAMLYLLLYVCH